MINTITEMCFWSVQTFTKRRLTSFLSYIALLFFFISTPIQAQTAHFSWAQMTLLKGRNTISAVVADASGNVYISDITNFRVYKLTPSGQEITIADAIHNGVSYVYGLAVDGNGNVFISDFYSYRVLKETPSGDGYTETVVRTGLFYPTGIVVDGSGNLYIANYGSGTIVKETPSGDSYTQTTLISGGLNGPWQVAVDGSGNLYIADTFNYRVLKETLSGGSYTQSILMDIDVLDRPFGLALDDSDNLYIADSFHNRVLVRTPSGTVSTLADGPHNGLNTPIHLSVDPKGNLFIADENSHRAVEMALKDIGFVATRVKSAGSAVRMAFTFDTGGTLGNTPYVLTQGAPGLDFRNVGTGSLVAGHYYKAGERGTVDVIFTPRFTGTCTGAVVLKNPSGHVIATASIHGNGLGPQVAFLPGIQTSLGTDLDHPHGVGMDGYGNVYVADSNNNRVIKETPLGGTYAQSTVLDSGLNGPMGLAIDGSGALYLADASSNRVLKETRSGGSYIQTTVQDSGLNNPCGLAIDGNGNVCIADSGNNRVLKETPATSGYTQTIVVDTGLNNPQGVAVDGNGNVYIADAGNNRVLKETPSDSGYVQTIVVDSGLNGPQGVAVDRNGNVYVADTLNHRVLVEMFSGNSYVQSVVADQDLNEPACLMVSGGGILFISDIGDNRITKVDMSKVPQLTFASTYIGSTSSDSPQTVTVRNIGNTNLKVPVPSAGHNPSLTPGFTLDPASTFPRANSGGSPGYLAPGANGTLQINFAPTKGDVTLGTLGLTDNHLNATPPAFTRQSISLKGTGPTVATVTLGHLTQTYTGSPHTPEVTTTPPGLTVDITYNGGSTPPTAAGTYSIVATVQSPNYQGTASGTLTVNKAMLTVKADSLSKVYNTANPALTYTITGFQGGETQGSATTGAPTLSTTATDSSPVGTYPITLSQDTLAATNYTFTCVNGVLKITRIIPVITWSDPADITYGTPLSGTQLNATASVPGTFVFNPASGTVVGGGTHVLSAIFTPKDTAHYATVTKTVSLTINKAAATVALGNLTQTYTGIARVVTATTHPAGLPVSLTYDGSATAPKAAGSYAVVATINSPNYQGSSTDTLIVNKAKATIALGQLAQNYNGLPRIVTATTTPAGLAVAITYDGDATPPTAAGTYAISTTVTSPNYQGSATGTLVVNKAVLTVKANALSKVQGAANPTLTYTMTGFKSSDTQVSATTGDPALSTTATDSSPVGTYPITITQDTLAASNYSFTFVNGVLTVTSK